jgi:hypothetical protein
VVAGNGLAGYSGDGVAGGAGSALLNGPSGVAVDASGNIYIADANNAVIRKVDSTHTITTVAGDYAKACGTVSNGSPATNFALCDPAGVATDSSGNLYIADQGDNLIRKVVVSTSTIANYAGNGTAGYKGDGGLATNAELSSPSAVAVDSAGNVYIADLSNYRVREVTVSNGDIATIAGNGTDGYSGDGAAAKSAEFSNVYGIAVNGAGTTVTIADYSNQRVRQFTVGGDINSVAGNGTEGFCGDAGPATSACFYYPSGVAVTGSSVYVADTDNNRIRLFTVGGKINTVAGNGSATDATPVTGLPPLDVVLSYPWAAIEDPSADIFVSDQNNFMIRELVESSDLVNFFAGNGTQGSSGNGGLATSAELNFPGGIARDSSGNIYIADTYNCVVRKVNTSGDIATFAGKEGGNCAYSGDGGPATSAELNYPQSVFVDSQNVVYIADTDNNVIRKVTAGTITTFAGDGNGGYVGDGGPATAAWLSGPDAVAEDGAGNVYIADTNNCLIREVGAATGIIETVAGNRDCGFDGDGVAVDHELSYPSDLKADANGNLFIADTGNNLLRWVTPGGAITTFAGTGNEAYNGDGGQATNADLYNPSGIYEDASGNFLVADQYNNRIRSISAFAGLGASADGLTYGLAAVGATSAPQPITLSGVGPLTIRAILVTGPFEEADNCGTSLPNGQTCTVYVYFKPTGAGTETGALTVQTNGYFNTATVVNLQGAGTAISITGAPLLFGNELEKSTSAVKNVTITNKGKNSITMGAITLSETTDFAIASNNCPASGKPLASKAVCTIGVTFTPQSTGAKKGVLQIADSDPTSPQLVGMTGTGTSEVTFSPASVNFGTQAIGTTSGATEITLTNTTGATITLGNPAVSVTAPFLTTGATTCTNSLPVLNNGTCVIYVEFSPTIVGYATGTLSVADTDATSPQTVALAGTGTGIKFTPGALNVGSSAVGTQISKNVTVVNVGQTTITITDAGIIGANATDFSLSGQVLPCGGQLAPAATCTVIVYFTPSKVGAETAALQLYNNSAASPQSLPLSGTGTN